MWNDPDRMMRETAHDAEEAREKRAVTGNADHGSSAVSGIHSRSRPPTRENGHLRGTPLEDDVVRATVGEAGYELGS